MDLVPDQWNYEGCFVNKRKNLGTFSFFRFNVQAHLILWAFLFLTRALNCNLINTIASKLELSILREWGALRECFLCCSPLAVHWFQAVQLVLPCPNSPVEQRGYNFTFGHTLHFAPFYFFLVRLKNKAFQCGSFLLWLEASPEISKKPPLFKIEENNHCTANIDMTFNGHLPD